jgi:hypothetical protein
MRGFLPLPDSVPKVGAVSHGTRGAPLSARR